MQKTLMTTEAEEFVFSESTWFSPGQSDHINDTEY